MADENDAIIFDVNGGVCDDFKIIVASDGGDGRD
jgi:hypothetical protein